MILRVKPSATEELPEEFRCEPSDLEVATRNFLTVRCSDRMDIIDELSHELIVVRNNYEEVLRRLNKYEHTEPLPEKEYDPMEYQFLGR